MIILGRWYFYYFEFQGTFKLSPFSTTALAVAAAAAAAAEYPYTLTSLCTLYQLIVSTGVYIHSYSIHVSVHSLHCPLVQEKNLLLLSQAQEMPLELPQWGSCKYFSSHSSTATLQEPSYWLVGSQECQGGPATGQHNPPPTHTQLTVERPSYAWHVPQYIL